MKLNSIEKIDIFSDKQSSKNINQQPRSHCVRDGGVTPQRGICNINPVIYISTEHLFKGLAGKWGEDAVWQIALKDLFFIKPDEEKIKMGSALRKEDAGALIDNLPESATWEDLMCEIYVREAVESGLDDSKAGRLKEVGQLRKEFGLLE